MRTELDHLPPQKQRELERVVQLIFEEFDDAFALAKHEWKKAGRILKVILYGSYARGTWVDEPHTAKGYQSDYDLLVIVNDKRLVDRVKYWSKLDDRLMRETMTGILHHNHGVLLPFFSPGREDEVGKALDSIGIAEA